MRDPKFKQYLYIMLAGFGAISMSIVLFFVLFRLQGIGAILDSLVQILAPFIYGGVVAYLLRPMCNAFEDVLSLHLPDKLKPKADILAMAASFVTVLLIVYALIAMIVPSVYDSLLTLGAQIPTRVEAFVAWAQNQFGGDERLATLLDYFNTSYENLSSEAEKWFTESFLPQLQTFIGGLGSSIYKVFQTLYNLLIGLIVAIYVLHNRKRFAYQGKLVIHSMFPDRTANIILDEIMLIDRMFGGFIDAKILDSAIVGLLCYVGCVILRMPNALLISVFVGVTNIIPFFGPLIGAVPSTLLILIENPVKAVWFVVFILVLQQLDGNVIGPRIMGNKIGISGFWVMFAILFFGGTWGIFGMVIGVPLFAVIYDFARKMVKRGLNRHDKENLWEAYTTAYPNEDIPEIDSHGKTIKDWTADDWKIESVTFLRRTLEDLRKLRDRILKICRIIGKYLAIFWKNVCKYWGILKKKIRMGIERLKAIGWKKIFAEFIAGIGWRKK